VPFVAAAHRPAVLALAATACALVATACGNGESGAGDPGSSVADGSSVDAGSPVPPGLVTLAIGGNEPNGMATDGREVFWASVDWDDEGGASGPGSLHEVSVNGGPVTVLAKGVLPYAVAIDATNVYWTDNPGYAMSDGGNGSDILRTPRDGGPTSVLFSGPVVSTGIAMDATNLYWGGGAPDGGSGELLMKMPLAGGAPVTLATATGGIGCVAGCIAVDSTSVYWVAAGFMTKVPIAGGASVSLAPVGEVGGLAVAAAGVYWTQLDSPNGAGSVRTVPLDGGEVTTIASYPNSVTGLSVVVDSTNVYWPYTYCLESGCGTGFAGGIAGAPLAGGAPTTLVDLPGAGMTPTALAVDATSLYWVSQLPGPCGSAGCATIQKFTPK